MCRPSPLTAVFLVVLVDVFGLALILPLLPFYAQRLGATPVVAGLLLSVYSLAQFVAGPILGRLSDRHGRKPVLLLSQVGTLAGFVLLAFAPSLWVVFVSRVIDGLTAGNITVAQAYVSDQTDGPERTRAFGMLGVAFGTGFLIGPALSGFLAQMDLAYPVYLACIFSTLSIGATHFLLSENRAPSGKRSETPEPAAPPEQSVLGSGRTILFQLLLAYFFYAYCFSNQLSGLAFFAERRMTWNGIPFGATETGYLFAYLGLVGIFVQGFAMKRLIAWTSENWVMGSGFLAMAIGFALLMGTHSLQLLLIALFLTGYGGSVLRPCIQSLITRIGVPSQRGALLGVSQSIQSVAQVVAPAVAGGLIGQNQIVAWSWLGAGLAGAGLLVSFLRFREN